MSALDDIEFYVARSDPEASPGEVQRRARLVYAAVAHELAEKVRSSPGWLPDGEWMDSRDRDHAVKLIYPGTPA